MGDLRVDYATLRSSAESARGIKAAFDGLPSAVGEAADCWGHRGIAGAMHTFGTNWGYHREILSQEIGETGEKLEKCLEVFEQADRTLSEDLQKSTAGSPSEQGRSR